MGRWKLAKFPARNLAGHLPSFPARSLVGKLATFPARSLVGKLATYPARILVGKFATIAGYGSVPRGFDVHSLHRLRQSDVSIFSLNQCKAAYNENQSLKVAEFFEKNLPGKISENHLCAKNRVSNELDV